MSKFYTGSSKMINIIEDSDQIVLNSVESFLKHNNTAMPLNPQDALYIRQMARDQLYSEIVHRVPRIAAYIMQSNIEDDHIAKGLFNALSKHSKDPVFIQLLMQRLCNDNNPEANGLVGALLTMILQKLIEEKKIEPAKVTVEKKSDKDKSVVKKEETPQANMDDVKHIYNAISCLLGNLASVIATRCGNITVPEAETIAAYINMNNDNTVKGIIESDLPVSAQVFDIVQNPSNIITSALNINKSDYPKPTTNQSNFIETLKKWVYEKLNQLPTEVSYRFLVNAYGSIKPETTLKLIQLKDCGTQYSNLLVVAKMLINN